MRKIIGMRLVMKMGVEIEIEMNIYRVLAKIAIRDNENETEKK